MAVFKPVARNINNNISSQEYLSMIEELNRLRRPTDVALGFGVDKPNAFILPQTKGVAQQTPSSQVTKSPVLPVQNVASEYNTTPQEKSNKPTSIDVLQKIIQVSQPKELGKDQDGNTYYDNGNVKDVTGVTYDKSGQVVKVDPEMIMFFDNGISVDRDGNVYRNLPSSYEFSGDSGSDLQSLLFKGESPYQITQGYGNYNPNPYYNYHKGVDVAGAGEWKVPISLPFNGVVVQRLVEGQGDSGYGNSLLIQIPTGEMFRLSHLSASNLQAGDSIRAGQTLGITGTSGNSTGYHLDFEYYDESGQNKDPYEFVNKVASNPNAYKVESQTQIDYGELSQDQLQKAFAVKKGAGKITDEDRQRFPDVVGALEGYQSKDVNYSTKSPESYVERDWLPGEVKASMGNDKPTNIVSEAIANTGTALGVKERGVSELFAGDISLAKQNLQQALGNNPQPDMAKDTTSPVDNISSGLDAKTVLDNIRKSTGIDQLIKDGGDLATKTGVTVVRGIAPVAFASTNNPIEDLGINPIGQEGSSGAVASVQSTPDKGTVSKERAKEIYTSPKSTSIFKQENNGSSNSGSKPSSKSSSKSSPSSSKPTSKSSSTKGGFSSATKGFSSSGTTSKTSSNPFSKSTVYGVSKPTSQPQSKKTYVFGKSSSPLSKFYKK